MQKRKSINGNYYRFPHYPKVESSCEDFHKPKWHKTKKQLLFIYIEKLLRVPRPQKLTSFKLFCYLRIHVTNGCTKLIKIKHRSSQTQFKTMAPWCWDAECSSGKELGGATPTAQRVHAHCSPTDLLQNKCWVLLFRKSKDPLQISFG